MVDDDEAGTAHHATIPIETRDAMMEDTIGAAGEPHASAWRHGRERTRQIAQQALVLTYDVLAWLRAKQRTRNGRRVMTALTWLGVGALCIYIGAAAVLYFTQRSLMYFPETAHTPPAAAGLPQAEEITLTTADGEHLIAWHVPPRDNKPVVLYLHGNGGSLRYRAERFQRLITDGIGLAAARYQVAQIVLWGESLGTGVAVALAAEKPVGRVILEAPFTSAEAVAAKRYWFMPVRLLMTDQFRSDARIGKVTAPLLILHGTKDDTVPFAMGQRMFTLANQPKHIVRFLDGGHDDLDRNGALIAVGRFLAGDLDP
jgi:hypothetical protein